MDLVTLSWVDIRWYNAYIGSQFTIYWTEILSIRLISA